MAVEKIGTDESIKKKITCNKCYSILLYLPIDVQRAYPCPNTSAYMYAYVECPECKNRVVVQEYF